MPRCSHTFAELLAIKPAQRTPENVEQLIAFLANEPFFAGVSSASLEILSACFTLQRAAPGEVVLHAGELTDRLILVVSGSLSVVRHSRREGFQPLPPRRYGSGQTLCEASLIQSGRRSDLAVTVEAAGVGGAAAGAAAGAGRQEAAGTPGPGGGAELAVLTRAAWSHMCARSPTKPENGEARMAMLCSCARALAATDPAERTLEQAEDLAALLRLLPGLANTSAAVLRVMSEAAYLRQLPPGTIMFEECTRAESEFVVLGGAVETHVRPKRQGAANRAALRSALRSAVAAARVKSAKGGPKPLGGVADAPKTVRQKIEEERRAREEIKQSLALQREGLRTPPPRAQQGLAGGAKAVEEEFKKWMLEFLTRKRAGDNPAQNNVVVAAPMPDMKAPANGSSGAAGGGGVGGAGAQAQLSKAASAWRRAAFKATHQPDSEGDGAGPAGEEESSAAGEALKRSDTTLLEYERRKQEEAGGMKDVGNLLGGAAARKAYMRGLAKDGGMYGDEPDDLSGDAAGADQEKGGGGVHWGGGDADLHDHGVVEIDEDEEEEDPWVRLTFLDRRYKVVQKAIRYIDAVEKVMGVAKDSSTGGRGTQDGAVKGAQGKDRDGDGDGDGANADDIHLLLLAGTEAGSGDADGVADGGDDVGTATGVGGKGVNGSGGGAAAAAAGGPGPGDVIDDACDEHFEQLYGARTGRVELGQLAGELAATVLDRSAARAAQRPRRAHSAIAGPVGADVLVVVLEALRRGHDAARDDLVSERLAMLTALEPLRGLSDEHQAQLALACTVANFDANHVIVRQGQPVDALYVVLEGEVRLLDESESTLSAAVAAAAAATSPTSGPNAANAAPQPGGASPAAVAAVAAGTSPAGGTGASGGPDSPFRSVAAGGKVVSLKTRRAAASLCALTLLGPGGSFGESVLGYPEDLAPGAPGSGAAAAVGATGTGTEGGEAGMLATQFLATAMTSRATRLLVMPRGLLLKYGYLKTSLPQFAALRREAINGRRQQLKTSLQNRPAASSLSVATQPHGPGEGGAAGHSHGHSHSGPHQLPVLPSPTAVGAAAAYAASGGTGAYQVPRPPPVRPAEVLEQLGFKPVMRRMFNGGNKGSAASSGAVAVSGASSTAGSVSTSTLSNIVSGGGGGGGSGGAAAAAHHVVDRQRRQDLLAASSLAFNAPQNLNNALLRVRVGGVGSHGGAGSGDDASSNHSFNAGSATTLPVVNVYGTSPQMAPRRASADGSAPGSVAALPSGEAGGGGGVQLPAAFVSSGQSGSGRPLTMRMSMSGLPGYGSAGGAGHAADGPLSPARRSSISGVVVTNGMIVAAGSAGAGAGGGAASAGVAGAHASPPRAGRLIVGSTSGPSAHCGSPSSAAVMLPRLSMPGNSALGMPLGGITGTGQRPAVASRASTTALATEPFLTRLDAAGGGDRDRGGTGSGGENSPRSYSPVPLRGRSGSMGAVGVPGAGGGAGVLTTVPVSVHLLQQRSAGHSAARA